jgi:hypothetical protein
MSFIEHAAHDAQCGARVAVIVETETTARWPSDEPGIVRTGRQQAHPAPVGSRWQLLRGHRAGEALGNVMEEFTLEALAIGRRCGYGANDASGAVGIEGKSAGVDHREASQGKG